MSNRHIVVGDVQNYADSELWMRLSMGSFGEGCAGDCILNIHIGGVVSV